MFIIFMYEIEIYIYIKFNQKEKRNGSRVLTWIRDSMYFRSLITSFQLASVLGRPTLTQLKENTKTSTLKEGALSG